MVENVSIRSLIEGGEYTNVFAETQKKVNKYILESGKNFNDDDYLILKNKQVGGK